MLKDHTNHTIQTYAYNILVGCDRNSVINMVTQRLIESVRDKELRQREDFNFAVELVLRILEYKLTFADFFKDLEQAATVLKEQLHTELSTPQMTAALKKPNPCGY